MYINGLRLGASARVKKIARTTLINWVKQAAQLLPNSYYREVTPEVGQLDELETPTHPEVLPPRMRGAQTH